MNDLDIDETLPGQEIEEDSKRKLSEEKIVFHLQVIQQVFHSTMNHLPRLKKQNH